MAIEEGMNYLFLSVSGGEIILILAVVLIFFGSKGIPEFARTMGKTIRQIKDATDGIKRDIQQSADHVKQDIDEQARKIREHEEKFGEWRQNPVKPPDTPSKNEGVD